MLRQIQQFFNQIEEQRLIQAARKGSHDAFDTLLRLHEESLRGFLYRRVGRDAMEDVLQEVRIACWQSLPKYTSHARFRTWIFAIARNKSADFQRSRQQREAERMLPDGMATEIADARNPYDALVGQMWVMAVLDVLTPEQKEVMELYYLGELNLPEIAELLGRNLNTVKAQFYRGHIRASAEATASHALPISPSLPQRGGTLRP